MSNHWVGYVMSEVSEEVCKMLDAGELPFDQTKKLIDLMQSLVEGNDGNSFEMWCGLENRCCVCLGQYDDKDLLRAKAKYTDDDSRFPLEDSLIQMYVKRKAYGPYCCIHCVKEKAKGE